MATEIMRPEDVLTAIDTLADEWETQRADRFQRRHLEVDDFVALADTGYLRLVVPEESGGMWRSLADTGPIIIDAVGRLARGDQSVALVASMHPTVMALWTAAPDAPDPYADVWSVQQSEVFQTAVDGHFWGTITSEPGSGGDILRTKATAQPIDGSDTRYTLRGAKHFGSGSEMVSYMITTAKPDDLDVPLPFYLDLRDQAWDGTDGLIITREWDGMGMKATQSHAVMLDGIEANTFAWPDALAEAIPAAGTLGLAMFCGVILAIVDAAMVETDERLGGKDLRPYEEVAWTEAQIQHWMLTQAHRGLVRAISDSAIDEAAVAATKAKMGMASMAESALAHVCRAVGGGAYSSSSPFATWNEDVRALGYLRPPWGLAFDQLIEARQPEE